MMDILFLIIGLIIGSIIGWLISKSFSKNNSNNDLNIQMDKIKSLEIDISVANEKIKSLNQQTEDFSNSIKNEQNKVIGLSSELASKNTELDNFKNKYSEQKKELEDLNNKLKIEFKNIANELLEEKSKKFTEINKTGINEILKPLSEKIKEFEKRVEETYDKESKQRFALEKEILKLHELNQTISKEANNLTQALKGQSKTQGNWGEIILESILEKSGLRLNEEYFVQQSHKNEEGKRIQPDIIVKYPGERYVVIDSKVSLTAYERFCSTDIPNEKEIALKEHLNSIKNHINELSSKNYQEIHNIKSLDFVMMFLPVEPAYLIAIQKDSELWSYAYEKRIVLISPTNLIAALKLIVSLWRQELQSKHANEIAEQSGALLDKFYSLLEDIKDIGNKISSTQKAYDSTINKLKEGKGNLINRAQKIQELGAKNKKQLPSEFSDNLDI